MLEVIENREDACIRFYRQSAWVCEISYRLTQQTMEIQSIACHAVEVMTEVLEELLILVDQQYPWIERLEVLRKYPFDKAYRKIGFIHERRDLFVRHSVISA
mgnify:CR=1 FL=1